MADVDPQDVIPKAEYFRLMSRAAAAYLSDADDGAWPDKAESEVRRFQKLNYVLLRDGEGALLAVYRLRREVGGRPAQLKRLVRWPEGLV